LDQQLDRAPVAGQQSLDASIAPVAHPAFNPSFMA
jgi:hypothetical protein